MKSKHSNKIVMLIDDNSIDNYVTRRIIEQSEFTKTIVEVSTAQKGLDYLSQHQGDLSSLPEIIFLDLNMPEIDGFTFLSEFENFSDTLKRKCRIIVLSSSDRTEDMEEIIQNKNVLKYFIKPLSPAKMEDIKLSFQD